MKKYSYLPGFLLIVGVSIRAALDGEWEDTGIILAALGAVIIAASIVWNRAAVMDWLRDPRGVFAVMTGIKFAALVAALVLLNILVWYYPWRADLTASGRNQLTTETRTLLERLDQTVTLRQFGRTFDPQLDQRLATFAAESRHVRVEFINPDAHATLAEQYGVIRNGTVVVEAAGRHRKVEEPTEQALMTAVLGTTRAEERKVCFVTGHGERGVADEGPDGYARVAETLEAASYTVERISLLEGDVPGDCAVTVIAGPEQPFESIEIERLDRHAKAAGGVVAMLDPDPGQALEPWITQFGITPQPGIIIDTSGAGRSVGAGPDSPLAFSYADHEITRAFEIVTMFSGARALAVADQAEIGRPVALASTSDRSFVTTERTRGQIRVDPARDRRGPFALAAATSVRVKGSTGVEELRLVVVGDSHFVSNKLLKWPGNRDLFLRAVAWAGGEEHATVVNVQGHENRRIQLTERTKVWMYLVNVGVLPLLPLTAGILIFARSRR